MSSKFSRRSWTQKPPGVCRRPPLPPEYMPPDWPESPYQGYVNFNNQYTGWDPEILATLAMTPNPPAKTWTGQAKAGAATLVVEMYWYEPGNYLNFDFDLYNLSTWIQHWDITGILPRSWSPFDTGPVFLDPQPAYGHLEIRILA